MQTEISTADDRSIALTISNGSVCMLHGEETRTAGGIHGITWPSNAKPVGHSVCQHGSAASSNTKAINLFTKKKLVLLLEESMMKWQNEMNQFCCKISFFNKFWNSERTI